RMLLDVNYPAQTLPSSRALGPRLERPVSRTARTGASSGNAVAHRHGPLVNRAMPGKPETIAISKFKATCLAVLECVRCTGPAIDLSCTTVSTCEALPLSTRGGLVVSGDAARVVADMLAAGPFHEAHMTHAVAIERRRVRLPHAHPADRFLVATARVYDLTLVTADHRPLSTKGLPVLANR